ncbi:MAG: hypothetical protein WC450_07475 [Candidatus Omnitrophota bacterium]|jgi:hypothetical protein
MKKHFCFCVMSFLLCLWGCTPIQETGKTLWGSSTRALEKARGEALIREFECSLEDCYNTALELTRGQQTVPSLPEDSYSEKTQETFVLFLEKRREHFFIVMGIPGSVNTTEAGVFFTSIRENIVQVEISSLSSYAKNRVADVVFAYLARRFESAK